MPASVFLCVNTYELVYPSLGDDAADGRSGSGDDEVVNVNWAVHSEARTTFVDLYVCASKQLNAKKCTAIRKRLPNGPGGQGGVTLHVVTPLSRSHYAREYREARELVQGVLQQPQLDPERVQRGDGGQRCE